MKHTPVFPSLPSGPVYYYRGKELLTLEEKNRLEALWGTGWTDRTQYVESYVYDSSFQTGLMDVLNILATIQNDPKLNEREQKLIERIQKGRLTYSKDSSFMYVEQKMVWQLASDGLDLYNKQCPSDRIKHEDRTNELYRIYGLPRPSIMKKVTEEEAHVSAVKEPTKEYKLKFHYEGQASYESSYKCYGVLLDSDIMWKYRHHGSYSNSPFLDALKKECPYVGKLYFSDLFETKYWQIYVYDLANSDRAVQNVVHFMKTYKGPVSKWDVKSSDLED